MVQANYCHCPSAVALQLPAASAIFVEGREGRRAHLFFSPGTQLIGLPSAPISLALMDSQSAVVAPHSSFGLRCISGLVLPVLILERLFSSALGLTIAHFLSFSPCLSNFGRFLCQYLYSEIIPAAPRYV